jgi:hypothetical protein
MTQQYINGMNIIVSPLCTPQAKLKVSTLFEWMTDEVREEINDWLLKTFGLGGEPLYYMQHPTTGKTCMVVGSQTWEKLKAIPRLEIQP